MEAIVQEQNTDLNKYTKFISKIDILLRRENTENSQI